MQVTKSGSRHGISNLSFKDCEEEHTGKIFASLKKHPVQHPVTSKILEVRNIYSPSYCRCTKWIEETGLAHIITDTHIHFIVVKYITKYRFSRHHIIQYHTISHGFYWHLLTLWQARKAAGARASEELCATLGVRNDQTISNNIKRAKCVGHFMLQDSAFGSSWSDVSARVITKSRVFPACCSSKCACLFLFGSFLEKKQCQTKPIQFVDDAGNLAFAAWSRSERSRQDFARNQMGPICFFVIFDHESYMLQHVTAPSFIIFVIWPHRWLHVLLQMRLHLCKQLPRWIVLTLDF